MDAIQNVSAGFTLLPGAFKKSSPTNTITNRSTASSLVWLASTNASSYEYCLDTTNDNACDGSWVNVGNTLSTDLNGLAANSTYFWQVHALNSGGSTSANSGTWWSFSTGTCFGLSTSSSAGGSVTVPEAANCAGGRYFAGTIVHLTATADAGYSFTRWSGDVTGTTNPAAVTMSVSDKTVTAIFTPICYTLTIGVDPAATGSVNASPAQNCTGGYTYGTLVQLTAVPAAGYVFSAWSGDLTGSTNPGSVTMNANKSVTASFGVAPPGAFKKSSPTNTITNRSTASTLSWLASTTASSYEYCIDTSNNTTCDGSWINVGNTLSVNLNGLAANTTYYWQVHALNTGGSTNANSGSWWSFSTGKCYALVTKSSVGGSVNVTEASNCAGGKYFAGTVVHLTAIPNIGYSFSTWAWNASGTSNPLAVTMSGGDKTVKANFIPNCYTLTTGVDPAGAGSVNASPAQNCTGGYTYNTTVQLTAVPSAGYVFSAWSGYLISMVNPGSVTMSTNRSVTASFGVAPPGDFKKSAPVNGATSLSTASTLTWLASTNASSYEYCLDTSNDNACDGGAWVNVGNTLSVDLNGLIANTTYYWQVHALNAGGSTQANTGIWWNFITGNCFGLTTSASVGGSVNVTEAPNCAGGKYFTGTIVHLTAIPDTGYSFSSWTLDASGTSNPLAVTMSGRNKSVKARFTK